MNSLTFYASPHTATSIAMSKSPGVQVLFVIKCCNLCRKGLPCMRIRVTSPVWDRQEHIEGRLLCVVFCRLPPFILPFGTESMLDFEKRRMFEDVLRMHVGLSRGRTSSRGRATCRVPLLFGLSPVRGQGTWKCGSGRGVQFPSRTSILSHPFLLKSVPTERTRFTTEDLSFSIRSNLCILCQSHVFWIAF